MLCARGGINQESTKNEHCTHTLKGSTTYLPCWVVKNIMYAMFLLFQTAEFSGWCWFLALLVNFVCVLLIKLAVNEGSDVLICPCRHLELLYRLKLLVSF